MRWLGTFFKKNKILFYFMWPGCYEQPLDTLVIQNSSQIIEMDNPPPLLPQKALCCHIFKERLGFLKNSTQSKLFIFSHPIWIYINNLKWIAQSRSIFFLDHLHLYLVLLVFLWILTIGWLLKLMDSTVLCIWFPTHFYVYFDYS